MLSLFERRLPLPEPELTAPVQRTAPPLDVLDGLPRLGWAAEPTPVQPMLELAQELGLGWLGCKRDDLTVPGHGGTKTRKLDFLLASPPWRDAPKWISVGAIGSGHLVACTAAAERLGRQLEAHLFWEPLSAGVLDNLAYTASGPTTLFYHSSRIALALRRPGVLTALHMAGVPVIPPGGTTPVAMLGLVRAGLELAGQVQRGELPEPQRLYVSLGSGGGPSFMLSRRWNVRLRPVRGCGGR
jgi:1-aminocyclopropane-1-carboxylate deaminase/D-cysteine desulfhydrase-like pyridoxal-dependent ACC family enzyme